MADDKTQTDPPEGEDKAAEEKFWAEHKTRTTAILDEWLENKVKAAKGNSDNRNGGRNTLPDILANLLFPAKK